MRSAIAVLLTVLFSTTLKAQSPEELNNAAGPAQVDDSGSNANESASSQPDPVPQAHPAATTYSNAYQIRLKIHKYASFATLPLFATEVALGQSLYNNPEPGGSKKALHGAVGAGIVGLFGVNTVTGVWNMWEGRHDSKGRTLKVSHGLLMLVADAGFVATEATAPHGHDRLGALNVQTNRAAHRSLALGSVAVASVSYLMMLFGGR